MTEHMNILLVSLPSVLLRKFIFTKLMGRGSCKRLLSLEH